MSILKKVIDPKEKELAPGFIIKRLLPRREQRSVGPFLFWDHIGPTIISKENEMIVLPHPHIGLATITWLFDGEILHRDSLDNEQMIKPGEVNWMISGNGVTHSERAVHIDESYTLDGLQIWIALPKEYEDISPSFFHCKKQDLPHFKIGNCELILIAGTFKNRISPVPAYSHFFYLSAKLSKDKNLEIDLESLGEVGIYIHTGELETEHKIYHKNQMLILKESSQLKVKAITDCQFLIFGGDKLPEKRYMWWNFVSTDENKIEEAKLKWKKQLFPKTINETDYVPLPE